MARLIETPEEQHGTRNRPWDPEAAPSLPIDHRPSTVVFRRIAVLWLADLATGAVIGLLILAIVLCLPLGDRAIRFVYAGF